MKLTRLRDRRERSMLTQRELALRARLSRAALSNIETLRAEPRFDTIRRLAEALDCAPTDLMPPAM